MNTEPLKTYLLGRDAYREGKKEEALKLIAQSMGADQPTPMMKSALGELCDLNDAALTILLHEAGKE